VPERVGQRGNSFAEVLKTIRRPQGKPQSQRISPSRPRRGRKRPGRSAGGSRRGRGKAGRPVAEPRGGPGGRSPPLPVRGQGGVRTGRRPGLRSAHSPRQPRRPCARAAGRRSGSEWTEQGQCLHGQRARASPARPPAAAPPGGRRAGPCGQRRRAGDRAGLSCSHASPPGGGHWLRVRERTTAPRRLLFFIADDGPRKWQRARSEGGECRAEASGFGLDEPAEGAPAHQRGGLGHCRCGELVGAHPVRSRSATA